jgi:pimeloyl-ACP methyl ester carboxylesterase
VEVAGSSLNVVDTGGSGPPLLLIHGLGGAWQNWLLTIPAFMDRHRVIAPDLPGFGGSEMPVGRMSIQGFARVIDELCSVMEIEAPDVIGNSMGGFIGAELAIQFPSRVERLVLVSAAGLTIEHQRHERVLGLLQFGSSALMAWGGWVASKSDALVRRPRARGLLMGFVVHRPDLLPAPLLSEQVRGSGKPGFVDALDALTDYPIRDRLGQIGCPTLIVWGENDHLVPARDADEFAALIPGSRRVVWPKTGHMAMLERPAAFNALVDAFVAEAPDRPGPDAGREPAISAG